MVELNEGLAGLDGLELNMKKQGAVYRRFNHGVGGGKLRPIT
jgi:hypothetical protein